MGADVRLVKAGFGIAFKEAGSKPLADIEAPGGKPSATSGTFDHPLGGLGFASWARELEYQEAELDVFFETVIVCSVTGSAQAGMMAGFGRTETGRESGAGAACDRHRRIGHAGRDSGSDGPDREVHVDGDGAGA